MKKSILSLLCALALLICGLPALAEEGETVLEADGFRVKKSVKTNDGTHTAGEVCRMSQVAQLKYEKGSEITLTVWGVYVPPPTTTAPPTEETTAEEDRGWFIFDF